MRVLVLGLFLLGCARPAAPACSGEMGAEEGRASAPLTAPDRYLLGDAVPLARDPSVREREEELAGSMAERRSLGWSIAAELLSDVEVAGADGRAFTVPRFATWYDREDLRRVHRAIPEGAPVTDAALDEAFAHNRDAVLDFEAWPEDRLAAYVAAIDDDERSHGLGGVSRVLYGPRAARHLLRSEAELLACRGRRFDLLEAEGSAPRTERVEVSGCGVARLGPLFVADGGSLHASVDGDVALSVSGAEARCDEAGCVVAGPARVELAARARTAVPGAVDVRFDDAQADAPCLHGPMPDGAAIVKADYRRAELGFEVDLHDTDPAVLRALREGAADWDAAVVGSADPGPSSIHTVELADGARYRLVGLHAMVKELDHWVWLTLYWRPTAGDGLSADAPAGLPAPFEHYAMCVVTGFVEGDPDPGAGLPPAAGAVLEATHEGESGSTWCSNPYLERGAGNAATNCVGCHQHGGSGMVSEDVLARFDGFGRPLVRASFPTDYVFSTQDLVDVFLEP